MATARHRRRTGCSQPLLFVATGLRTNPGLALREFQQTTARIASMTSPPGFFLRTFWRTFKPYLRICDLGFSYFFFYVHRRIARLTAWLLLGIGEAYEGDHTDNRQRCPDRSRC